MWLLISHSIQNTKSILENGAARDVIFEKKHRLLYPHGYHHLVSRGFCKDLKEAGVISIRAIYHFLNEAFQMLCVTPE